MYLSYQYPPHHWGGIGTYTANMARAMASRGHDVHVLSCHDLVEPSDEVEDGVVIHRRPLRPVWRQPAWNHPTLWRLRIAMSCYVESRRLKLRFDVIESPDHMGEGLGLALLGRTPVVACLHDGARMFRQWQLSDLMEHLLMRRAALVRSPSRMLLDHGAARGWFRRPRAQVLSPPIELDAWQPTPLDGTHPLVLVVGLLHAVKAPEVAVRAAARLRDRVPGLHLVIIGRSMGSVSGQGYSHWLKSLAASLEVSISLIDEMPRASLREWYARSRVVAVPSHRDNYPMVALEAMACGRPVVCTQGTGTSELLRGSRAGLVVPVDDPPALADALAVYLLDSDAATRAGRAGRELVETRHAPEVVAQAVEHAYLGLLSDL